MRINEILIEALTPEDQVVVYQNTDNPDQGAIVIGGRILPNQDIGHTLRNISLKNVRSPHGPLLFHGSSNGDITKFHDQSWLSAEPVTAITHAQFWAYSGKAFIYVCSAKIRNPIYNPDIVPGAEKPGEIDRLYKANPDKDAIIWKDTKDSILPKTDLYNIKFGYQIQILKKWEIIEKDVSQDEWDHIFKNKPLPKKTIDPSKDHVVIEPGLTPFEDGEYITQKEYDEYKQYGLKAKPIK